MREDQYGLVTPVYLILSKWATSQRSRFYSTTIKCPLCNRPMTWSVVVGNQPFRADRTIKVSAHCCMGH